jgi:hypothetical protein
MNLNQELLTKYPRIFHSRTDYWIACGDGWCSIIDTLCLNIQQRIDWNCKARVAAYLYNRQFRHKHSEIDFKTIPNKIPQVRASQVKEKFGGLRFYFRGGDAVIDGMVQMAESMSLITCDVCGNVANSSANNRGWVKTRCKDHE